MQLARDQRNVELNNQLTQSMQDLSNLHRQNAAHELEQKGIQQSVAVLPALKNLDPAADDYDKQLTGVLAENPYASQDPAVKEILRVQGESRQHYLQVKDRADTYDRAKAERDATHADTLRAGAAQSGLLKEYDAAVAGDPTRGIKGMDPIAATAHVVNVGQNNQQYNQMKQLGFTDQEIFEHKDQSTGLLDPAKAQESILQKQKEIIPPEAATHAARELANLDKFQKDNPGVALNAEQQQTYDQSSRLARLYNQQLLKNAPTASPDDIRSALTTASPNGKDGISDKDIAAQNAIPAGLDWRGQPVKPGDKGWMPQDEIKAINDRRDAFLKQNNVTNLDTIPTDIAKKPDALFQVPGPGDSKAIYSGKELASVIEIKSLADADEKKLSPDALVKVPVPGSAGAYRIARLSDIPRKSSASSASTDILAPEPGISQVAPSGNVVKTLPASGFERAAAISENEAETTRKTKADADRMLISDLPKSQKRDSIQEALGYLDKAEKENLSTGKIMNDVLNRSGLSTESAAMLRDIADPQSPVPEGQLAARAVKLRNDLKKQLEALK